jgi:phospholipase/lecithinase/hemolysin
MITMLWSFHKYLLFLLCFSCSLVTWAQSPYSDLVVFGDSLSDTGNLFNATRAVTGRGFPAEPNYQGRFANGEIWVDFLKSQLGLSQVNNLAWGGASTGGAGALPIPKNLQQQLQDFGQQVQEKADPNALYIFWIGANDLLDIKTQSDISVIVPKAVSQLLTAVRTLNEWGARHVLILTLPDLGETPRAIARQLTAELSQATAEFNQQLWENRQQFQGQLFDVTPLMQQLQHAADSTGIQITTEPCLEEKTAQVCEKPDHYLFWDDQHPTSTVHRQLAAQLAQSILPSYYTLATQQLTLPLIQLVDKSGTLMGEFNAQLAINPETGYLLLQNSQIQTNNGYLPIPARYEIETGLLNAFVWFETRYYSLQLQWHSPATPFHAGYFGVVGVE